MQTERAADLPLISAMMPQYWHAGEQEIETMKGGKRRELLLGLSSFRKEKKWGGSLGQSEGPSLGFLPRQDGFSDLFLAREWKNPNRNMG